MVTARTHTTQALAKAAELMKKFYDAKRDDQPPLPVGSKVWLENTNITPFRPMKKLAKKRYGPFEILETIGPSAYKLKIPSTWKGVHPVFNEVLLTPFNDPLPSQSVIQPPLPIQTDPASYEVEAILDTIKQRKKTTIPCQMAWLWPRGKHLEPLSNLMDAKDALAEFRTSRKRAPGPQ